MKRIKLTRLVSENKDKEIPWIVPGFTARGEVTIVFGPSKHGKTSLVLEIAKRAATGEPWVFSRKPSIERFQCSYYSLEMGEIALTKRALHLWGESVPDNITVYIGTDFTFDWNEIAKDTRETGAAIVIVDNIFGANLPFDVNKAEKVAAMMNAAFTLAQNENVGVVLVHHTRKGERTDLWGRGTSGDPLDNLSGSKMFVNRASILVQIDHKGGVRHSIDISSRLGESKSIPLSLDSGIWRRARSGDIFDKEDFSEDIVFDEPDPRPDTVSVRRKEA